MLRRDSEILEMGLPTRLFRVFPHILKSFVASVNFEVSENFCLSYEDRFADDCCQNSPPNTVCGLISHLPNSDFHSSPFRKRIDVSSKGFLRVL